MSGLHRIRTALQGALARQQYLTERYFEGLGASGAEARLLLESRSREERELERLFNDRAIPDRRRYPPPPGCRSSGR